MIKNKLFKFFYLPVVTVFIINTIASVPVSAQHTPLSSLPLMAESLQLSAELRGMTIDAKDPLRFEFIVDGELWMVDKNHQSPSTNPQNEYLKLIHYFLAALTTPEDQLWVNLSPDEPDRILPKVLDQTQIGRDLIGQDYLLKQLTASLLQPDNEIGKKFWEEVYEKIYDVGARPASPALGFAARRAGRRDVPLDIPFDLRQKVWIVPDVAKVAVRGHSVFITEARLKVMTQEDYLGNGERGMVDNNKLSTIHHSPTTDFFYQIILPAIEKEINEGEQFAQLRQMYQAMILASWYKKNLKQSLLGQTYVNQNKTGGIDTVDPSIKDDLYQKYLDLFRNSANDLVREEYDPSTQAVTAKHYISGGYSAAKLGVDEQESDTDNLAMLIEETDTIAFELRNSAAEAQSDPAMLLGLFKNKEDELAKRETELRQNLLKEYGDEITFNPQGCCWAGGAPMDPTAESSGKLLRDKASTLQKIEKLLNEDISAEEIQLYLTNLAYSNTKIEYKDLSLNRGEPDYVDPDDWAMLTARKGGIDLNAGQMNLQEDGAAMAFDPSAGSGQDMPPVDPAQLQNVAGYIPVIISISPTDVGRLLVAN